MEIGVIGGGIVGLTLARALMRAEPAVRVTVIEKESAIGRHQTGHNSGVVHAGLYYRPGSLKAELCARGRDMMREYCAEQGLPFDEIGKLVVAVEDAELAGLAEIERRSLANAVPDLRRVAPAEMREIEPQVRGVAGLYSPHTAVTDFAAVARSVAADLVAAGGQLRLGAEVIGVRRVRDRVGVMVRGWASADPPHAAQPAGHLDQGAAPAVIPDPRNPRGAANGPAAEIVVFDRLVICAGLQGDRLAAAAGDDSDPRIVPFLGMYYRLVPQRRDLVRGLIYPVPDARFPFLGVHLTRTVHGEVLVGPNAVLGLAREAYRATGLDLADLGATLTWPGFYRLAARYWRAGARELAGAVSRRRFLAAAQRYVPQLTPADITRAPLGVRAQAVGRSGDLADDFVLRDLGQVIAVRNAPSPAATSSFAIAEYLVPHVLG